MAGDIWQDIAPSIEPTDVIASDSPSKWAPFLARLFFGHEVGHAGILPNASVSSQHRTALDKFCERSRPRSIMVTISLIDTSRLAAATCNADQNTDSSEMLDLWPSTITDRFGNARCVVLTASRWSGLTQHGIRQR